MLNKGIALVFLSLIVFIYATFSSIKDVPSNLSYISEAYQKPQVLDRSGKILSVTYQNEFNVHSVLEFSQIPELLKQAFVFSEDKRFYDHHGVDWYARINALYQRLSGIHRGASTITEQVVRMIHIRPRSLWSRWLEGFEARKLEKISTKEEILSFYLNQVPFAARRRGVQQAALYYFDRSINTLSEKEILALAVLVRAPSRLKLNSPYLLSSIDSLASKLLVAGKINAQQREIITNQTLSLEKSELAIEASQFVKFAMKGSGNVQFLKTTLDTNLQKKSQEILEERLVNLKNKNVSNGAILIVENKTASILSWVNAKSNGFHDAVRLRRQAGSTLKPFLYALALSKGWTAASIIEDAPIDQAVGRGLHAYRNYSRTFYGPLRLREALGNSLNSTAIRTIGFVGTENFINILRDLKFNGLNKSAEFYGDGIALGNAEVSLFELVQAYRVLANRGEFNDLNFNFNIGTQHSVFSKEVTSIISDILSDPQARRLEFSANGIMRLPVQTAIKTGTSNDFRDAWAIGFTSTHTVGVWLGNLNRRSMSEVSGAQGPAYVLRSVFAEIARFENSSDLYLSPELHAINICPLSGKIAGPNCQKVNEWFVHEPTEKCEGNHKTQQAVNNKIEIKYPTPGLNLALDPRIPDDKEVFEFSISSPVKVVQVIWVLDDKILAKTKDPNYSWKLERGRHRLRAEIELQNSSIYKTDMVGFWVK